MQEIIDILLVMAIGVIALVAALLIPSKAEIQRNETANFKSGQPFIYAAGVLTLLTGILILFLFLGNTNYQDLFNIPKMLFLLIIGPLLLTQNVRMSRYMAACESGAVPMIAQPLVAQPFEGQTVVAETMPVAQPQAAAQPTVAVTAPIVQAQPQVGAQQIGIKTSPTVQAQPQAVQPQPAQPQAKILTIKCPKCQGAMQIDTGMLGQKIKCPHCGVEGKIG